MAVKSTKEKKTATPKNGVVKAEKSSKTSSKKNDDEEDADASDEDDDLEETDDWGKTEEEDDSWDPDFAEFDMPKTTKKAGKAKKGGGEDAHASDEGDDLDLDLNLEDDDLFDEKDEFDDDY
jgi:DNA-directed RNA polymerase subunit delta